MPFAACACASTRVAQASRMKLAATMTAARTHSKEALLPGGFRILPRYSLCKSFPKEAAVEFMAEPEYTRTELHRDQELGHAGMKILAEAMLLAISSRRRTRPRIMGLRGPAGFQQR